MIACFWSGDRFSTVDTSKAGSLPRGERYDRGVACGMFAGEKVRRG